ncbi:MAG: GNAT family N-acetyltransferase [candidate division WOR-3 bacterium]|nr:GNAT family N-acetyltransferase [candidate division WOR-3 bacterium]
MKAEEIRKAHDGFTIRKFRMADYDSLLELWDNAGLPHKPKGRDTRENISREINHPNAVFLVAEKDGCLIGSAFGTHDGRKGWINRVAVLPAHRRQGIAADLVEEIEKHITRMGIGIIACLVEEWNRDSLSFFQKMGYVCHKDIFYLTKREVDYI